jgi:hypothetical protein
LPRPKTIFALSTAATAKFGRNKLDLRRGLLPALAGLGADLFVIRIENSAARTAVAWGIFGDSIPTSFGDVMSPLRATSGMRDARGELAVRELFRQHPTEQHAAVGLVKQPVSYPTRLAACNLGAPRDRRTDCRCAQRAAFNLVARALAR